MIEALKDIYASLPWVALFGILWIALSWAWRAGKSRKNSAIYFDRSYLEQLRDNTDLSAASEVRPLPGRKYGR